METYFKQVQVLSYQFISLLAEAFALPSDALNKFYDTDELMQHRGKAKVTIPRRSEFTPFQVIRYPANDDSLTDQGIGPHSESLAS